MKLCYILPEYDENTDSHFYHLYEFLEQLSNRLDIFLVIEKSVIRNIKLAGRTHVQRFHFFPLRFLESFLIILKARLLGYKNFYTHYCYIGGINAGIISRLFGGKSYYWNCAMNWLFKQSRFSKIGLNLCLKLSHYLVTGSETMKQGYAEYYGLKKEKIKVMPNWINLARFQPRSKVKSQKSKIILFVHWLSKRKGVDVIVPIVLSLKSIISNFKLLVVGNGPYKENLVEQIRENKLQKYIKILGGIPQREIVNHYSLADIFLMPSMEEGFPRVLLEAMAMGVPYVASEVGAVREMSPEIAQRFLVKPGDIEMFAHKIETLLLDKELYNNFRIEELEKIKEYSLEKIVDKFIKIIS